MSHRDQTTSFWPELQEVGTLVPAIVTTTKRKKKNQKMKRKRKRKRKREEKEKDILGQRRACGGFTPLLPSLRLREKASP